MGDDLENEVLYEFDMCNSRESYIKPSYLNNSRKYVILFNIMAAIVAVESIVLLIIDRSSSKPMWMILLFAVFFHYVFFPILQHNNIKKLYKKIHEANEDHKSYVFYKDRVRVKTPTAELTLAYDTAEGFTENDDRLIIVFSLNRAISIEKEQCDEEMLGFLRSIVPDEKQKKTVKKNTVKSLLISAVFVFCAANLAVVIVQEANLNASYYYSKYPKSTYESFDSCLEYGLVKDVVIIKNEYIEYTFTGRGEDEKYFTVYPGDDIDLLTNKLNALDVDWKFE